MSFTREIHDFDFDQHVLQSASPVVVLFYTTNCGPCKQAVPQLEELGRDNPNIKFVRLNTDKGHQRAQEFGVHAHPSFKVFQNAKVVGDYLGYTQNSRMQAWIEQSLGLTRTDPTIKLYG